MSDCENFVDAAAPTIINMALPLLEVEGHPS